MFQNAREKPEHFQVIQYERQLSRKWSGALGEGYVEKCPFPTRLIKEFKTTAGNNRRFMLHHETYNGHYNSHATPMRSNLAPVQPKEAYLAPIPINIKK